MQTARKNRMKVANKILKDAIVGIIFGVGATLVLFSYTGTHEAGHCVACWLQGGSVTAVNLAVASAAVNCTTNTAIFNAAGTFVSVAVWVVGTAIFTINGWSAFRALRWAWMEWSILVLAESAIWAAAPGHHSAWLNNIDENWFLLHVAITRRLLIAGCWTLFATLLIGVWIPVALTSFRRSPNL